jgi:hypothetical protein
MASVISSFAKTCTVRQGGLKYRIEFAGRTRDNAQHVRRRRLLLQRFGKFLCAQLDLFLQVGIRFLQPAGHVVELSGERLDLVSSLDGNAPAEVAAAEVRRTGGQRFGSAPTMRRARNMPAAKASASAPRRTSPVRWSEV